MVVAAIFRSGHPTTHETFGQKQRHLASWLWQRAGAEGFRGPQTVRLPDEEDPKSKYGQEKEAGGRSGSADAPAAEGVFEAAPRGPASRGGTSCLLLVRS